MSRRRGTGIILWKIKVSSRKFCPLKDRLQLNRALNTKSTHCRCLGLSPEQCDQLVDHHHVHLPRNGRINVAGLNLGNIGRTAEAIDAVVRGVSSK